MEWCEDCVVQEKKKTHARAHTEHNAAVHKLKKNLVGYSKIGAIWVKYIKFHTEDPQILGVAV
jgi:hypothetical protein